MSSRDDPELLPHLEAENRYTEAMTAHLADLRERLFEEMLGRIKEDDASVPARRGEWWYSRRTEAGRPYPILCRQREGGEEEVMLDLNAVAEGSEYFSLGAWSVSPDQRLLAYVIDTTGDERHTLRVRDLTTRCDLPGAAAGSFEGNLASSLAWASDSRTLFATTLNPAHRPWRVIRCVIGEAAEPVIVFSEPDERFFVSARRTRSGAYVLISAGSSITSEVHFIAADEPMSALRVICPRHPGMEYTATHSGGFFYITTNDSDDAEGAHDKRALNFKLVRAPVGAPDRANWTEVIAHDPHVTLLGADAFERHLVLSVRAEGYAQLDVLELSTGRRARVEMPEDAHALGSDWNLEFDADAYRFQYGSLRRPDSVFSMPLAQSSDSSTDAGALTLLKERIIPSGYDRDAYRSARLLATAPDGAQVPISLVWRGTARPAGPRPLLLIGYGAYGICIDPWFASTRLSLIDRGAIVAIAHVRGGAEMGRGWYEGGKLEHKARTFSDYIACAEHLVAEGWTTPQSLAIRGGSAGGLLIGAVLNARPELFAAAVARVPFVDVVTTMLDESIPLTAIEWEEWGDPRERAPFDRMLAYSPYDNVAALPYPPLLITGGLTDPRVQYWEPAKWTARLRERSTSASPTLLKMHMGAGHAGESGRYGRLRDNAFITAWLIDRLELPAEISDVP